MSNKLPHPLCAESDHWFEVITLRYHQFLEAITALSLADARRHLAVFSALQEASIEFTDSQLEKLNDQDSQALQMLKADHLILGRTVTRVEHSLAELEAVQNTNSSLLRSTLVDKLDSYVRLKNILEHHITRAEETLYPYYQSKIDHETGQTLADQLTTIMQGVRPH